nr:hypothetical protein [Streptomyces broussonetiae]
MGQVPSRLQDHFIDYLETHNKKLRYSQCADPCSAELGLVFRAQRARDLLSVVVLDAPARFRGVHDGGQRRVGGQVGLPAHAPDLNPVEGIWSLLGRGSQANTAFTGLDHAPSDKASARSSTAATIIDGRLAETGLTTTTSRQQGQ